MNNSLNFGIDFDGTYTEDPDLWLEFFEIVHRLGHKSYIVTLKNELLEGEYLHDCIGESVDGILFTSRHGKEKYIKDKYNIDIDIWIDKDCRYILEDHPGLESMMKKVRDISNE